MSFAKYLKKGKIKLLCGKIELSMKIQLKTIFCQLISENRLEKRLKMGKRKRFAIFIIVNTSKEAVKLYSKGLRFEKAFKIVKKY